jgi:hypothetical protein
MTRILYKVTRGEDKLNVMNSIKYNIDITRKSARASKDALELVRIVRNDQEIKSALRLMNDRCKETLPLSREESKELGLEEFGDVAFLLASYRDKYLKKNQSHASK